MIPNDPAFRLSRRLKRPELRLGMGLGMPPSGAPTPTAIFDFASGQALDSRISFARGSAAWRFNAAGLYESVAQNLPRFNYDPTALTCRGLLIEDARTNLLLYSRDLTQIAWGAMSISVAKTATGIDGVTNSASTLTALGANATLLQMVLSASAERCSSAYVKRRTGSGTIHMTQDGGTTWTIVAVTSAWTRVSVPAATVLNPTFGFRIVTSGDAIDVDFCQLESGPYVTSAVPTTGSTASRSADSPSITGSNFSNLFDQARGTIIFDLDLIAISSANNSNRIYANITDGSGNEMYLFYNPSGDRRVYVVDGGVAQASISLGGPLAADTRTKFGLAYEADNLIASRDGRAGVADNSATLPTVDRLELGHIGGVNQMGGHLKAVYYWRGLRLPDATLRSVMN